MKKRDKVIVLLSGGLDSGVLLWWLKDQRAEIITLSLMFPGRRKKEVLAARKIARLAGSTANYEVHLPFVPPPKTKESCYIPKKNLMYYSIAASLAETVRATKILGGHIKHDGAVFKDARESYLMKISRLADIPFSFPFIDMNKKDIIKVGSRLGVPFQYCWSCSRDGRKHCWSCKSCSERKEGFKMAAIMDPLLEN